MTGTSIWDDKDLKVNDDYVKFDVVGDSTSGTIMSIKKHTFPATNNSPEKTVPQLLLMCDDGVERTLTAGQVRLLAAFAEQRPTEGDHITVRLTEIEKRGGGKTLKHFSLEVAPKGAAAAPAATPEPASTGAASAIDPKAAAAALANLSDDEKKALGIAV